MRGARRAVAAAAAAAGTAALALVPAGPAGAQGVPSGQSLVLWEALWERVEGDAAPQAVLRFLAPGIAPGGGVAPEAALADLAWLCETHGLPMAALPYAPTGTVVITLMDRPVPRGTTDPEATQYFGLFALEDGACVPADL